MQKDRQLRVLVVDDDELLCELLRTTFELEGIDVDEAHHVIEAERSLAAELPDAIVLDIGLPGVDGLFYTERLRESPRTRALPIVVVSGSEEAGARALAAGARAFVHKPFNPLELLTIVERIAGRSPLEHANADGGAAATGELSRLIEIGHRQHELLNHAYRQTLEALADALETRDFGTSAHSHRVTAYATRLTLEVAPSLVDDPTLEWGFLLHDVGKIGIPDRVLLKRGPLDVRERTCIEQHTLIGEKLVGHVPLLQGEGMRIVRSHHERWDGDGYPDRLTACDIPIGARIFAVADALDAMTDVRPYRSSISWDDAMNELVRNRSRQFDPEVIDALPACEPDLRTSYEALQSGAP